MSLKLMKKRLKLKIIIKELNPKTIESKDIMDLNIKVLELLILKIFLPSPKDRQVIN